MMLKENLWVFIHLPKAGGTTFNGHCAKHLDWDETFVNLSHWGKSYRKKMQRLPLEERSPKELQQIQVISGHRTWYGIHNLIPQKEPKYLTIVRDPATRMVSRYNFSRSRGDISDNFETWYKRYTERQKNPMTNFYAKRLIRLDLPLKPLHRLEIAKQLLDRCWYVALTEQLDTDLEIIFSQMNLPLQWKNYRVAGEQGNALQGLSHPKDGERIHQYYALDERMRDLIRQDHSLDNKLYEYAIILNKESVRAVAT